MTSTAVTTIWSEESTHHAVCRRTSRCLGRVLPNSRSHGSVAVVRDEVRLLYQFGRAIEAFVERLGEVSVHLLTFEAEGSTLTTNAFIAASLLDLL